MKRAFGQGKRGEWGPPGRPIVPPQPPAEPLVTPQGGPDQIRSIRWKHNRCPDCGCKDFSTYRTEHVGEVTVRWHACKACGLKFKSGDDGKG